MRRRPSADTVAALVVVMAVATAVATGHAEAAPAGPHVEEAQQRFRRATELYHEGDWTAALVEFKRAYELVPSYKILFNLGQVSYQRHDYAAALRYFQQYLTDGGDAVPAERRRQVSEDVARLEPRVGRLDIDAGDAGSGAEVLVDDVLVGTAPLAGPLLANEGRRRVEIVSRAGERLRRTVDLPGGETVRVTFAAAASGGPEGLAGQGAGAGTPSAMARSAPGPVADSRSTSALLLASDGGNAAVRGARAPRASRTTWPAWAATALLAGGAAVAGVLAWRADQDLRASLDAFPASNDDVARAERRTRALSLTADGLGAGALVLGGVSLYLTFR